MISAHNIFNEIRDEIFNLRELGELEIPILTDEYAIPSSNDMLRAYFQSDDRITVEYNGHIRTIPCPIDTIDDDYIARCIMKCFAQICLNKNESINRSDAIRIIENTITRLVNEGVVDLEDDDTGYHSLHKNKESVLSEIEDICSDYPHYLSCGIDKNDIYVDFDPLFIIISISNDGEIYVSQVEGKVVDNKKKSIRLWNEVSECIRKINGLSLKL